jgi:hypothetical protein
MSLQLSRFKVLDTKIKTSLRDAGKALEEIRDKELYRQGGFKSFKDYCESIGKTYNWGWQQIEAGKVQKVHPEVKTVNQALEVRKLAMPQRRQMPASESGEPEGKTDAPTPKKAVASLTERKKEVKLPLDGTGIGIPPEIQDFWNRNEEIDYLLGMVKKVRLTLEKADQNQDRLYFGIDRQGTISRLKMAEEEIVAAKSYAVCPQCNGIFFKDCQECKKRGTLSKFWWERQPEEIKKLRE